MMDMNLNLDVTMESAGHTVVHHGPGIHQGFFDSSFFHCRADTQSIDFDSVVTTILVANGARPACMATMVKQVDASPTAIALIKSIIVLDHAPFSIKCNKSSATNCFLSNK